MNKPVRKSGLEPVGMFEDVVPVVGQVSAPVTDSRTDPMLSEMEASAMLPNQQCPITQECRGRMHAFNTITRTVPDESGKPVQVKLQQLKCNKCGKIAKGARVISGHGSGNSRLFNRVTGKAEF